MGSIPDNLYLTIYSNYLNINDEIKEVNIPLPIIEWGLQWSLNTDCIYYYPKGGFIVLTDNKPHFAHYSAKLINGSSIYMSSHILEKIGIDFYTVKHLHKMRAKIELIYSDKHQILLYPGIACCSLCGVQSHDEFIVDGSQIKRIRKNRLAAVSLGNVCETCRDQIKSLIEEDFCWLE